MYRVNLDAALTQLPATALLMFPDNTRVQIRAYTEAGGVSWKIVSDSGNDWNEMGHLALGTREPINRLRRPFPSDDGANRVSALYRGAGNFLLSLGVIEEVQP